MAKIETALWGTAVIWKPKKTWPNSAGAVKELYVDSGNA